jgi:MoxR-like ATPase
MQCYEGLDEAKAIYEWKYGKQLLYTQILRDKMSETLRDVVGLEASLAKLGDIDEAFFSEQFLEPRPLLRALRQPHGAVLLVDEVDKSDQEFEAFLLEILSDYAITIPELGTFTAIVPPLVVLTSNNSRDLGDALKRRCLHLHIGYPDQTLEQRIIEVRVPEIEDRLRRQLVAFVQRLRGLELKKLPSVSETIDWARALLLLHVADLEPEIVRATLNLLLKYEADVVAANRQVDALVRDVVSRYGTFN